MGYTDISLADTIGAAGPSDVAAMMKRIRVPLNQN